MAKITSISVQAKDPDRCNLYLDGIFYCGITLESVVKFRLKEGMEIERESLDRIQSESELQTAFDKALDALSRSMKTEASLRTFLKKKGYVDVVVDQTLEKLASYGFVDDFEYAKRYASSASKGKGKKLIALELRQKGVGEEEIEDALSSVTGEVETAKALFEKYMRFKERNRENRYKAFQYLLRRGFDYETAKEAAGGSDEDD